MQTLKDFDELTKHFIEEPKNNPRTPQEETVRSHLFTKLEGVQWNQEHILSILREILKEQNIKMPTIYYLLTGKEKGLPLPETLVLLGKDKTLSRLKS